MSYRLWVASLLAAFCCLPLFADPAPLSFRRITSEQGLSHNSVYALLQDRTGFLWIGTVDGLNRYDGHDFVIFRHDPRDPASLSNPIIRCLAEDHRGDLWIGTNDGVNRFDRRSGTFQRFTLSAGPRSVARVVHDVAIDRSGVIWAASERGLYRLRGERGPFEAVALKRSPAGRFPEVHSLAIDPGGAVWCVVAEEGGRTAIVPVNRDLESLRPDPAWGFVRVVAIDAQRNFHLKPGRAAILDRSSATLRREPGDVRQDHVWHIRFGSNGTTWMTSDQGLCRQAPDGAMLCQPIVPGGSWLDNYVRDVMEDRAGAVWVGTLNGFARADPAQTRFHSWKADPDAEGSLSSDAVSSICEDGEGIVWLGTFGGGLNLLDRSTGKARAFRHQAGDPHALPHDVIWSIAEGRDGRLWLATEEGLASFDSRSERFERHPLPFPAGDPPDRRLTVLAVGKDGLLWLSGPTGLYAYDPVKHAARRYFRPAGRGLPHAAFDSILPNDDGTLWAGSGQLGLFHIDPRSGVYQRFPLRVASAALLASEGIWSIARGPGGMLWLGSGSGLSRFDPRSRKFAHWFVQDGLPGSVVYSVASDPDGSLWVGTNRGLARFNPRAPRGREIHTYEVSDGIAGMEFNRNAVFRSGNDELFFGGIGGLTTFFPSRIREDPRIPAIAMTSIEYREKSGMRRLLSFAGDRLVLAHDNDPFGFEFVALTFTNPERSRYAYRLEGFDRGWIEAGPRRFARYTNVPAGRYRFQVIGSNQDGVWNDAGIAFPLTILPPFWQTWWFRSAAVLLLVTLLVSLHRYRVARLLEMERIRFRIASDLHDDLSSDLSGMSMTAELMRRDERLQPEQRERLTILRDRAVQMSSVMRDTSWSIHPEHDTVGAMVRRMKSAAEMLLGETLFAFHTEGISSDEPLGMTERRNLFLIFKELVHNVARHARAQRVTIDVQQTGDQLSIRIADDGIGFDLEKPHDGDGLRNVRRRAAQIGGALLLHSRAHSGTVATVVLPRAKRRKWRVFGMVRRPRG